MAQRKRNTHSTEGRKMKTEKFDGSMDSAFGVSLPTTIKFEGTYEAYETYDEADEANDLPSRDEQLTFCNNKRKANARQKAMNAALNAAGIVKPTLEDPQVALKSVIKAMIAQGKSEAEATAIAEQVIGVKLVA
jgi:hypothetical protein